MSEGRERVGFVGQSDYSTRIAGRDGNRLHGPVPEAQPESSGVTRGDVSAIVAAWLKDPFVREEVANQLETFPASDITLYRLFDSDGVLLYVGITNGGRRRIHEHASMQKWWRQVATATFEHLSERTHALSKERYVIEVEKPKYNKAGVPKQDLSSALRGRDQARMISNDEMGQALEKQTRRHFALGAEEFIEQFREGRFSPSDPRLRFVVNLLPREVLEP